MRKRKNKSWILLLLSTLMMTACNNKDETEPSIFNKTYNYNGLFTHLSFDDESQKENFNALFFTNYSNELSFRNDLLSQLGSVGNDPRKREKKYENQIVFDSIKNSHIRTFNGNEVTTYNVNPFEESKLAEITVDPDNTNQYRFISQNIDKQEEEYVVTPLLIKHAMSPYGDVYCKVYDNGIVASDEDIVINYQVTMSVKNQAYTANGSLTFELKDTSEINFIIQPTDVSIKTGDSYSFEVEVDHPELVQKYQWYSGSFDKYGQPSSLKPLKGSAAKNRKLEINSSFSTATTTCYQCVVTTAKGEYYSDYANLVIEDTESEIPSFYVLDRAIKPGSSLDLATTPYGNGIIAFSDDGTLIEFNNVYFTNTNMESCLQNIGMSIRSNYSKVDNITFKFNGSCTWDNTYWEDDHNQGGFALFVHFANESTIPTITFEGDSLTVKGGTRAISVTANLIIKNSISLVGVPNRLTSGIFAYSIKVKTGASISANIGGSVLSTLSDNENRTGYIQIEDGVVIDALIKPGKVNIGETQIFGFLAQTYLFIDGAIVNLHFIVDYEVFSSTKQYIAPLIGMYSNSSTIKITNSDVNITMEAVKVPVRSNVLASAVEGIAGPFVIFDNSNINIKIDSSSFYLVRGIESIAFEAKNDSDVKVYVHGAIQVTGIVSVYKDKPTKLFTSTQNLDSIIRIENSNIDVEANADHFDDSEPKYYTDTGIRGHQFSIELDEEYAVHVKTNGASALVSAAKYALEKQDPSTFVPQYLLFDGLTINPSDYSIDPDYYIEWNEEASTNYYIILETLKEASQFLTEITISNKTYIPTT